MTTTFTYSITNKSLSFTSPTMFSFTLMCVSTSLASLTLSSEITTNWETDELKCSDTDYRIIFRYKPSGTYSTGSFTDQEIFTNTDRINMLMTVQWTNDDSDLGNLMSNPIYSTTQNSYIVSS